MCVSAAGKSRMEGVMITVDDKPCRRVTSSDFGDSEIMNVECQPAQTGRRVKLSKNGDTLSQDDWSMNLCEVQIWGKRFCIDASVH